MSAQPHDTDLITILGLVQPGAVLPQPPKRGIDLIKDLVDELNKLATTNGITTGLMRCGFNIVRFHLAIVSI